MRRLSLTCYKSGGRPIESGIPDSAASRTTDLEVFIVKFVHFVKRVMPKRSLKAYAWYGWI
jgi:hypothetical protein